MSSGVSIGGDARLDGDVNGGCIAGGNAPHGSIRSPGNFIKFITGFGFWKAWGGLPHGSIC